MSKKILLILAFLLISIAVAFGIYFVFFKPSSPSAQPSTTETQGNLPAVGVGPSGQVITTSTLPNINTAETSAAQLVINQKDIVPNVSIEKTDILNPEAVITSSDGGLKYYSRGDSTFYRLDSSGNAVSLSDKKFTGVSDIVWSDDTSKAILQYPDGYSIYYDFNSKKQITLPKNWSNFSFSPDSQKIAFINEDLIADNRWLATAKPDGSEVSLIEPVGDNADKVIVDWSPSNQVVAFARTGEPQGTWLQEIYLVGLHGENYPSLTVNGRNFESLWSPTGQQLIYSVYNDSSNYQPTLWITDAQGDNIGNNNRSINLNTWADKCAFSPDGQIVYCGVPTSLQEASGMIAGASWRTTDYLYKINLATGEKSVLDYSGQYNITDIKVSSDGKKLYFTDHLNNNLEEVILP